MIEFPWAEPPETGASEAVAPGIRWVRMPLPFRLDHVNCWLLGEGDTAVLIDTGLGTRSTRKVWQALFRAQMPGQLLVTHFHPDHMGLAGWFHEQGLSLLGSAVETDIAREIWAIEDEQYGRYYADWYQRNGLPDHAVTAVKALGNSYRKGVHEPPPADIWEHLDEDASVNLGGIEFTVLNGRGHAPAMLMLYSAKLKLLIAADQVLPSITPNVSLMLNARDPDPLSSFLQCCKSLKDLPIDTLVLPSHGLPFRGLHDRLDALINHHDKRLAEVRLACQSAKTPYALFDLLFGRKLDAQQMSFALGESLAHLVHLESKGELERFEEGGLLHFQRVN